MDKAAFIDIDNTLVKGYSQFFFLKFLFRKGIITKSYFLKTVFIYLLYRFHILKDSAKLRSKYYRIFKGWKPKYLEDIIDDFFNQVLKEKIFAQSKNFLDTLRNDKFKIYLLSATLEPIAKKLSHFFQVDDFIATKLEVDKNGIYTGQIDGEVIKYQTKIKKAVDLSKTKDIDLNKSYFISDDKLELTLAKNFGIVGHLVEKGILSYKNIGCNW